MRTHPVAPLGLAACGAMALIYVVVIYVALAGDTFEWNADTGLGWCVFCSHFAHFLLTFVRILLTFRVLCQRPGHAGAADGWDLRPVPEQDHRRDQEDHRGGALTLPPDVQHELLPGMTSCLLHSSSLQGRFADVMLLLCTRVCSRL